MNSMKITFKVYASLYLFLSRRTRRITPVRAPIAPMTPKTPRLDPSRHSLIVSSAIFVKYADIIISLLCRVQCHLQCERERHLHGLDLGSIFERGRRNTVEGVVVVDRLLNFVGCLRSDILPMLII